MSEEQKYASPPTATPFTFFHSADVAAEQARILVLKKADPSSFKNASLAFMQQYGKKEAIPEWQFFCAQIKKIKNAKDEEKLRMMKTVFCCLENPVEHRDLVEFITQIRHLKSVDGLQMVHALLKANVPKEERHVQHYVHIFRLLVDLHEEPDILDILQKELPHLSQLLKALRARHAAYIAAKYPEREVGPVMERFAKKDDLVQFPLDEKELGEMKMDYDAIKNILPTLVTEAELQQKLQHYAALWRDTKDPSAKQHMLAILAEGMRRTHGILPYDTQILSLLALINYPEKSKGRIAQIKTGEGKSSIIAMLSACMAAQGHFVDVVTSSDNLAARDCKKYQPFYASLGLSAGHVGDDPEQTDFHAKILYATNTGFEFAFLRDGLYNSKLRYSKGPDAALIERPFDTVIIDEVDNLFLDTARNSAQMGVREVNDAAWIYSPILDFLKARENEDESVTEELITELRQTLSAYLLAHFNDPSQLEKAQHQLASFSDAHLTRWCSSANTALYTRKKEVDYIVRERKADEAKGIEQGFEIVIVDYNHTGRTHEGCQWQHGVHQFLQLKHELKLTPPTKTGASVAHPSFFNQYQTILGLTGTMGEDTEREEIKKTYGVESFDVPSHIPSARTRLSDYILPNRMEKWALMVEQIKASQQQGTPMLLLFKTIEESNAFSAYLADKKIKHQLLNETQREAEDYLVDQAGESGVVTIATNTAGRGTDIVLSPASKKAGGLQVIFGFYPDNLRVEAQGFGRAGRQGQPGSCWMVLDMEDENIQSLRRLRGFATVELAQDFSAIPKWAVALGMQLETHAKNQYQGPADEMVGMLNALRSKRIQKESVQRSQCAQEEMLNFKALQTFFSKMNQINTLMQDPTFQQEMRAVCTAYDAPSEENIDTEMPYLAGVQKRAGDLLALQWRGNKVEWTVCMMEFKEAYLTHVRNLWASYYSKLRDEIEVDNREAASLELAPYLSAPKENILAVLHHMLALTTPSTARKKVSQGVEQAHLEAAQLISPFWSNGEAQDKGELGNGAAAIFQ